MKLAAPNQAPAIDLKDVYGNPIVIANGKPTLLSFFRDTSCPFCNVRIYELTKRYENLAADGLNIVAIFASSEEQVKAFVMQRPRPFVIAADPTKSSYGAYGIGSSFNGKVKGIVKHFGTFLRGLKMVGLKVLKANNVMPADFLITPEGQIIEAHYGVDIGDRLDFAEIEAFAKKYHAA